MSAATEADSKAISIHALRVEGDAKNGTLFYLHSISIHALRVEGDAAEKQVQQQFAEDFYPRPPGGGRLAVAVSRSYKDSDGFLSTPSGWRATKR